MPDMTIEQKFQAIVDRLAGKLTEAVKAIESDTTPTTQNHYGDYMAIISRVANGNSQIADVASLALIQAGANRQGVLDARKFAV